MKKFCIILFSILITASVCYADDFKTDYNTFYQKKVMEIGFRILNANHINKRMTFYYNPSKNVKTQTFHNSKRIVISGGLIPFLDSDDEIASVIAHEISHGADCHKGLWRRITMTTAPKSYEHKSDLKGVDFMVNAGYNPLAMIVVINKTSAEPNWFEKSLSKPEGIKRLINIYDYIYSKYPEYLINNEYKKNLYYQNFLLTTKEQRKIVRDKYMKKNNIPVRNKN